MKRFFDILFSILAGTIFLPFGLIIMMILRFTGEGEIFYRQQRVGKDGKLFGLLKYATMIKNSSSMGSGLLTVKNDPRVLPFGRILRKTKLNEIPQLWNILIGEMSIIGPRPQAEPHFRLYSPEVQKEIQLVRPGLSGIGSIVFRDEENILAKAGKDAKDAYERDISAYKGALEVWYVRNHTLWMDFLLILCTILVWIAPGSRIYREFFPNLPKNDNRDLPV